MTNTQITTWIEAAQSLLEQNRNKAFSISLVGDLALDRFVFGSVDRISPEAPVPVLLVEREEEHLGCAANVARSMTELTRELSAFQFKVHGLIGVDATAQRLKLRLEALAPRQVQSFLVQDPHRPTPLKTRFLAGSQRSKQQMLRVDQESKAPLDALLQQQLEKSVLAELKGSRFLIIQDYAKGVLNPTFLKKLLTEARANGVKTLVDPNRNTPAESYVGSWMITPNVEEAEALLGRSLEKGVDDDLIVQACRDLKTRLHVNVAAITRSRYGLTLLDENDQILHVPALAREVADVTGAGDTVVAVLALSLSLGATLDHAAELANAAAAVVVGKVGTATASWTEIFDELRHRVN
jgi:D-beta-D-heptose 7-phosphate kinase/D-beta-D-heptose 1-phosphate adenosyltransferase